MSSLARVIRRHEEKLKLIGFFVVMVVISTQLFRTLGRAWRSSVVMRPLIDALQPVASVTREQFAMFWLGVFVGLMVLVTIDPKKRVQGVLLWIGTVASVSALTQLGLLLPNLEPTQSYGWALAGFAGGVLAGGGRQLLEVNTPKPTEFRLAGRLVFYVLSLVVVVGLVEAHVEANDVLRVTQTGLVVQSPPLEPEFQTSGVFTNVASAGVFLYTLNRFIEYDSDSDIFIIGPSSSGKSLFLIGMFKEAQQRLEHGSQTPVEPPSPRLQELVDEFSSRDKDGGWILESTQGVDTDLSFSFVAGGLFPKNVTLSCTDYSGEQLTRLAKAIRNNGATDDQKILDLNRRIEQADTLVYFVDCERFVEGESLGISSYTDIISEYRGKRAIVVATKADLLADDFEEATGRRARKQYDEFREYVNQQLRQDPNVLTLLQNTGGEAYPVYYETVEQDGTLKPMRNNQGKAKAVGFDELMDRLG